MSNTHKCHSESCHIETKNPKFCSLRCSNIERRIIKNHNLQNKRNKEQLEYKLSPKYCLECNSEISFIKYKNGNKFCNHTCAATYTSNRKDYTKIRTGPKPSGIKIPTKLKEQICVICNSTFLSVRKPKSCSKKCYSILLSNNMKRKIYFEGYDPTYHRGRHKKSYMESSFEEWLKIKSITNYTTEHKIKRKDIVKTYYADFYFPDHNLIIELDGTQHEQTVDKDRERDDYIQKEYGYKIIRISYREYQKKSRMLEIMDLLGIENTGAGSGT